MDPKELRTWITEISVIAIAIGGALGAFAIAAATPGEPYSALKGIAAALVAFGSGGGVYRVSKKVGDIKK